MISGQEHAQVMWYSQMQSAMKTQDLLLDLKRRIIKSATHDNACICKFESDISKLSSHWQDLPNWHRSAYGDVIQSA